MCYTLEKEIKNRTIRYGIVALLLVCVLTATVYNFGVQVSVPSDGTQDSDLPQDSNEPQGSNDQPQSETPDQSETPYPNIPGETTVPAVFSELDTFTSLEEMETFLNDNLEKSEQLYTYNLPFLSTEMRGGWDSQTFGGGEATPTDYSTTNVQVEGVDEADIVKSDGEYLYVVSGTTVYIVKAYPTDQAAVVSKIELEMLGAQIYVNENRLAVLASGYTAIYAGLMGEMYRPYYDNEMFVKVYDITNKTNPVLSRTVNLNGTLSGSRMIGDYAYVVVNQVIAQSDTNGTLEVVLPTIYGDHTVEIPATRIRYMKCPDVSYTLTNIIAINIMNDTQEPTYEPFLTGYSSEMYVSLDNMYLVVPNTKWYFPLENGTTTEPREETLVYRIALYQEQIVAMSEGSVPGYVNDQFSMDENGDYFRIATTTNNWWSSEGPSNNLYVMNMSLSVVGQIEGLAQGETIYSARFMGNRGYIVTFRNTDPLFVIDLTEPTAPTVLGYLKVTGYSDYLHPYDENHIIGIGKETEASGSEDFAWYQGVKISLFDVSNVSNPVEVAKYEIGDRGTTSPLLDDHKALLFDKERNLFVIPVTVAEIDESKYPGGVPDWARGDYVWQGAYVLNISPDGITLRGTIAHIEDFSDFKDNYWSYSDCYVERALYIEDVLYTVSEKIVKMNDLESLDLIKTVELS